MWLFFMIHSDKVRVLLAPYTFVKTDNRRSVRVAFIQTRTTSQ